MLSDEEKKAIESLKNIAIYIGDNYTFSQQGIRNLRENLRIVLPVIEKQSKEIEHQKEKRENQKKELAILNAKQIEFNKLVNTVNSYKEQFKRQQKEIEELKQIKSKLDEKNIPIETLLAEFERLEDLEDDLTTVYLNGVYDGEKKVQDKIKAKIEEYKKQQKEEPDAYLCIKVLRSLLEKE